MKNLILTTAIIICSLHIKAQTLNKYHGGNGDGYASGIASKSIALPVMLTSFTAEVDHEIVTIKWTASFEINSEVFIVQRSKDGIHFEIGNEISAHGNSFAAAQYSFSEQLTGQTGTWYYKLLQKDMNQEAKSMGVKAITITLPAYGPTISVYPNPANSNLVLTNNETDSLSNSSIMIMGNDCKVYYIGSYSNPGIDVSNYAEGIYYLTSYGKRIQTLKFVVKH